MSAPEASAGDATGPSTARSVLADRVFGPYFAGATLSNIGTWFQNLAAAILVFRLTGSTFLVGVVNFAQFAASLLLAPWTGSAADRFDRRRLLQVNQVVAAVVTGGLAVLTALDLVSTPIVVAVAFLVGITLAFSAPALLALVPLLVRREDLDVAISLNSVTFNLARAVGPVLATVVIAEVGLGAAFGVNAVSFLVFAAMLVVVRPRTPQQLVVTHRPRLSESIRLVWDDEVLRILMIATVALSATTDPVNTLTPEFATTVVGDSDTLTGYLVGAFGAGATATALFASGWLRRRRRTLTASLVVEGIGMAIFGVAPNLVVAIVGMVVAGAGFLSAVTRSSVRIQLEVADDQRGRVMAIWSLAFIGSRPLASLLDGAIADLFGPRVAAVAFALPAVLGVVAVVRVTRRREARVAAAS